MQKNDFKAKYHHKMRRKRWLKCSKDPRKTASMFALQEQMIEIRTWKKIRGLIAEDMCRLCGEQREIV